MPQMFPIYWFVMMVVVLIWFLSVVSVLHESFYLWEVGVTSPRSRGSEGWL